MPTRSRLDMGHPEIIRFQLQLAVAFRTLAQQELAREAAVALARELRDQLSRDVREESCPHARSLESLMRAVTGALTGEDRYPMSYVCDKLEQGINDLLRPAA